MSRTTILRSKCPQCGKLARQKDRLVLGDEAMVTLECGHMHVQRLHRAEGYDSIASSDGRELFPYQIETCEFIEQAGGRALIGHEMGLGKTVIALSYLKQHRELLPALVIVKSGLRAQWFKEAIRWTGIVPQIIESGRDKPHFDFFPVTLVSADTLRLLKWPKETINRYNLIVIDECQLFKNSSSARTQALRGFVEHQPHSILPLSGTAIKNSPEEYFTVLNLLQPELFPSEAQFCAKEVKYNEFGKVIGLKNPDRFHEMTKEFVIRFQRDEVLPDLPKIFRVFRHADMSKDDQDAYQKVVEEFQAFFDEIGGAPKKEDFTNILAYFSRMRQITGIAKVNAAVDFAEEFLLSTDRKLVIFLHHKVVGELVYSKLKQIMAEGAFDAPALLTSSMDMQQRAAAVERFSTPGCRILVASTLAAGEGLNLQFCSDCLIMERQWNPANEEQAEARFPRPGSTADKVNATYLIASRTIDEFLTEIVEKKRGMMKQALDNEEYVWNESNLMSELMNVIAAQRFPSQGGKK